MNTIKNIIMVLIVVAAMSLSFWWMYLQWGECKALGHSTFYCIQHIAR